MIDTERRPPIPPYRVRATHTGRGMTLVEMVIVALIVTVLSTVGIVRYRSSLSNQRVDLAAKRIAADIALVQSASQAVQAARTIQFLRSSDKYVANDVVDPQRNRAPLSVTIKGAPFFSKLENVNFNNGADLTFDARGRPSSAGVIVVSSGGFTRTIAVDGVLGDARVQP